MRKNQAAVQLAKRRAKKLSAERRSEIARLGAAARLAKANGDPDKLREMTAKASAARRKSNGRKD